MLTLPQSIIGLIVTAMVLIGSICNHIWKLNTTKEIEAFFFEWDFY